MTRHAGAEFARQIVSAGRAATRRVPRRLRAVGVRPASAAGEMAQPDSCAKPAGNGPFAAVVVLHDCTGLGPGSSGAPWRWASELTRWGYVTIWPDSFSQRGHPRGVCTDASPPRITREQRADDAYEALAYLRSLPFVDARRVAVMGGSHGGASDARHDRRGAV